MMKTEMGRNPITAKNKKCNFFELLSFDFKIPHARPAPSPLSYETFFSTNERVDRDTHTATRNLRLDCGRVVPVQCYDGTISDVFYRLNPIHISDDRPIRSKLVQNAIHSTTKGTLLRTFI